MRRAEAWKSAVAALATLTLLAGCDDDAAGGPRDAAPDVPRLPIVDAGPDRPGEDAAPRRGDGGPAAVDGGEPPVVDDDPGPDAAWIEVELSPPRALYTLDDAPTATATVFDRFGDPIPGAKVSWSVEPPGIAEIDDAGRLTFLAEGQGAVRACVAPALCGRTAFYVDAGPPSLVVDEPARGAVLGAENSRTIRVSGTAGDGGGRVTVRVNGVPVEVDAEGRFALDVEARFGLNRVEVTADDGVRRPPVRVVREVLWAPAYLPVDEGGASVPRAMDLRLDQALLDRDLPVEVPAGAAAIVVDELAQVVALLLRLAEPTRLLEELDLGDGDTLTLRAVGLALGTPEIDLAIVDGGIELFVRLADARIDTEGGLVVEGERLGLDGSLYASLAAFARLRMGLEGGELAVRVEAVEVAVERLEADLADPAAEALLGTFGSRLRVTAETLVADAMVGLLREELPSVVRRGLESLIGELAEVPLRLDPDLEGFAPVTLRLGLTPSAVDLRRRRFLRLALDARVDQERPVMAPHPDPGVPALSADGELVRGPGAGLTGGVRLALLNALLHEVWRAGLLRLAPPLPDNLAATLGEVRIDGVMPPVIAPTGRGAEFPLELQIGELRLVAQGALSPAPDVYALSLRAGLWLRVVEARFELVIAGDPDVRAELIEQGGPRPVLPPAALGPLVEAAVWPQLQDALAGGLRLGLDPVTVPPEALQDIAPRVRGIALTPRFVEEPERQGGHLILEGGIDVRVELGPP